MEHLGCTVRQVDNPAWNDRSAVIDADVNYSSVVQVGNAHPASERERGMSRGEVVHVVRFTAGGGAAFEILSVPGCGSYLVRAMMFGFGRGVAAVTGFLGDVLWVSFDPELVGP